MHDMVMIAAGVKSVVKCELPCRGSTLVEVPEKLA